MTNPTRYSKHVHVFVNALCVAKAHTIMIKDNYWYCPNALRMSSSHSYLRYIYYSYCFQMIRHEIGVIGYMLPKPINYSVFAALADNDTGVQSTSYCYNFLGNIPRTSYHIDKSTRRRWHIAFCSIVFF